MRKRNSTYTTTNNLDLHGVKHQDVEVMVEEYVLLNMPPFQIITGHSNTMKNIVKGVLNKHDFKYLDGFSHNLGCIVVL